MSKSPEWDAHGRHRTHPRYNEPDSGNAGTENGKVVADRQRLGVGGSAGFLDERELPITHRPTAGDVE